MSGLYEQLASQARPPLAPPARPARFSRGRAALVAVAASVVLVAGTAAATEALDQGSQAPVAVPAPGGQVLRTATFETPGHRAVGQIVAYGGHPSWVFMNVDVADYDGRVVCMLEATAVRPWRPAPSSCTTAWASSPGRSGLTSPGCGGRGSSTPAGSLVGSATFA